MKESCFDIDNTVSNFHTIIATSSMHQVTSFITGILVKSMPGVWLYLHTTSLSQKTLSLLILNTHLDLIQCWPCGMTNHLTLCHTPWLFIYLNSSKWQHATWPAVCGLGGCKLLQMLWIQAYGAQRHLQIQSLCFVCRCQHLVVHVESKVWQVINCCRCLLV